MEMEHLLVPVPIAVDDEPVAALGDSFLLREVAGDQQHVAGEGLVLVGEIVDGRDLPVQHDEDVGRGGRVDVAERGHPIVFVDDVGGQLACDDLSRKLWTSALLG